jgi:hypothetical protein
MNCFNKRERALLKGCFYAVPLYLMAVVVIAQLTGCITIEGDEPDTIVVVEPDEPEQPDPQPEPTEPEQPDPQPEPEPWCGLEMQIAETSIPAFGEDWTNGHPFEVGDTVGYLDVVRWDGWSTLTVHTFNENNVERSYSLSARMVGPVYAYCEYYVSDVLVDNPRVFILYGVTCSNANGTMPQRWVELSIIDTEYGTDATFGFWELAQEMYENYQLGLDNGNLLVGSYNVFSAVHSVRPIHRDNGLYWAGDKQAVSAPDPVWASQRFIGFEVAADGVMTFVLADQDTTRTTHYRACE